MKIGLKLKKSGKRIYIIFDRFKDNDIVLLDGGFKGLMFFK